MSTIQESDQVVQRRANLEELRKRNVYAKISGLPRRLPNEQPQADPAVYTPMLDMFWDIFGEDFLVYAGVNKTALEVLHSYSMARGRNAAEKFFWKNSVPAYKWVKRDPKQPQLG